MTNWLSLNAWLGKRMFLVVVTALIGGIFFPLSDSSLLRQTTVLLFAYMTFVTALSTSLRDFLQVLRHPWQPLWILALVHLASPFTAWIVGHVFYPDEPLIRIGYLIGASIPVGVTSIIWTALVQGDLAVSLVAVTLDTFLVPLVLPAFFHFAIGETIEISYLKMVEDLLLMVTIPSLLGMLCNDLSKGRTASFAKSVGGVTSKLSLSAVIFINSAVVMPLLSWNASTLKALIITLGVVSASFFVGWLGSLALKDRRESTVLTMIYNVGIRNNACGVVLALSYFPPAAAIPITMSILYQQPVATLVPYVYRFFKRLGKEKNETQSIPVISKNGL